VTKKPVEPAIPVLPCCSVEPKDAGNTRDAAFFSVTQSICPQCRKTIQAKILFRGNQVIMVKRCGQHGVFESLLSPDLDYWMKSLAFSKPGLRPNEWSTEVDKGCPDDCGLCEDHEQHTCSPIIEISNHCDIDCPVCIVWNRNSYNMSLETFKGIVGGLIRKEGGLEVVLLSGGEPTLHPQFFEFCEYITAQPEIKRVLVSSHGLRIVRDPEFAERFRELGLYLSLQFDTLDDGNYKTLRGAHLLKNRMACLQRCEELGIPTVIVPTVARGVNEHELGQLVNLVLSYDCVTSVTFQPVAYTGSGGTAFPQDAMARLTQRDIHTLLEEQTTWLSKDDFVPVPCSHPSCYSAVYVIRLKDGSYLPLTRIADLGDYMDLMVNRAIIDGGSKAQDLIQDAVYQLWSAQALTIDSDNVLNALRLILDQFGDAAGIPAWKRQESQIKAIFIHAFMDEYDFELSRIRKCCTHYALPDGRLIPGCAYNNVHRMKDERLGLTNVDLPLRAPLTDIKRR
jgi:7,8-dihydro-6-hydroxymethylpterin dimethyltransferase